MSNYSQITAFTPKDLLPSGNPAKVIKGSDFDGEFNAISVAIATKAEASTVSTLVTTVSDLSTTVSGQVTGPASVTDNKLVRFDGTTGKLVQEGGAYLFDDGSMSTTGSLSGGEVFLGVSNTSSNPSSSSALYLSSGSLPPLKSSLSMEKNTETVTLKNDTASGTIKFQIAGTTAALVTANGWGIGITPSVWDASSRHIQFYYIIF